MNSKKIRFDDLFWKAGHTVRLIQADLGELEKQIYVYYSDLGMIPEKEPLTEEDKARFKKFMENVLP